MGIFVKSPAPRATEPGADRENAEPLGGTAPDSRHAGLREMGHRLHQQLVDRIDLQKLQSLPPENVREEIRALLGELANDERGLLTAGEQQQIIENVMDEAFGLGPLEPLLKDPTITDILVNRADRVYIERSGRLALADIRFRNEAHLRQIIDRIVARVGRRIDETSPMVDARLPDGSRVNAIIPPLALDGAAMSIRRFGVEPLTLPDLIRLESIPRQAVDFLAGAVQARCSVLISGGTGSGKTTLLNCFSRFIPAGERLITIEDAAELQLQQPHVVRLETRPPNIEEKCEVTQRDLVRNSLRMRPDRIIIGEVRGPEALDMLQAMNTGHEGSMTTIHANSTRDALARLEVMVAMAGLDIPVRAIRQQIASAINIVIQAQRLFGGRRKVVSVAEITGMEGEQIQMHDVFVFEQTGVDDHGNAVGEFKVSGVRPWCLDRIEQCGIKLPQGLFVQRKL